MKFSDKNIIRSFAFPLVFFRFTHRIARYPPRKTIKYPRKIFPNLTQVKPRQALRVKIKGEDNREIRYHSPLTKEKL